MFCSVANRDHCKGLADRFGGSSSSSFYAIGAVNTVDVECILVVAIHKFITIPLDYAAGIHVFLSSEVDNVFKRLYFLYRICCYHTRISSVICMIGFLRRMVDNMHI